MPVPSSKLRNRRFLPPPPPTGAPSGAFFSYGAIADWRRLPASGTFGPYPRSPAMQHKKQKLQFLFYHMLFFLSFTALQNIHQKIFDYYLLLLEMN